MATRVPAVRIANSIRLIYAMFRLAADIETGFGKAVVDILKKQYPDQDVDANPSSVGHKMMAISRKQNQNDPHRSMDALQDFLTYITTGSEYQKDPETGKYVYETDPETKEKTRVPRSSPAPWNFRKDFATWQEALNAIYSNIRLRGMSQSMGYSKAQKRTKDIDKAFGTRPEGGGAPEGGEGRMPTPDDTALGKALDDKAAIKEFVDLIDSYLPDLRKQLTPASRALFDLIFEDNVGTFGSDIKENMGQATALRDKMLAGSDEEKKLVDQNQKRWSGFVGDTRKKLLDEIWSFIDSHMAPDDYEVLRETFFSETTPKDVKALRDKREGDKASYQRGLDERKYSREKWKSQNGLLDAKAAKSFKNLEDKLKKDGVDVSAIEAVEPTEKEKKGKAQPELESEQSQVASRVAARWLASRAG